MLDPKFPNKRTFLPPSISSILSPFIDSRFPHPRGVGQQSRLTLEPISVVPYLPNSDFVDQSRVMEIFY